MWHGSCPSSGAPFIETRRTAGRRNLALSQWPKGSPMRSVIRRRQFAPTRRRTHNHTLRRVDRQVLGAGCQHGRDDHKPADRMSDSADGRREALNWLAEILRWERTLD